MFGNGGLPSALDRWNMSDFIVENCGKRRY